MGSRRQSRELALQFLYGFDMNRGRLEDAITDFWDNNRAPSEIRLFTIDLIKGTLEHLEFIDGIISDHATNWRLERIALVDKNILRLAIYELYFRKDIPPAVTINEAVEVAKKFSTPQSGRFVNGILDKINVEKLMKEKNVKDR